jgi:hypothetical protein
MQSLLRMTTSNEVKRGEQLCEPPKRDDCWATPTGKDENNSNANVWKPQLGKTLNNSQPLEWEFGVRLHGWANVELCWHIA